MNVVLQIKNKCIEKIFFKKKNLHLNGFFREFFLVSVQLSIILSIIV